MSLLATLILCAWGGAMMTEEGCRWWGLAMIVLAWIAYAG